MRRSPMRSFSQESNPKTPPRNNSIIMKVHLWSFIFFCFGKGRRPSTTKYIHLSSPPPALLYIFIALQGRGFFAPLPLSLWGND